MLNSSPNRFSVHCNKIGAVGACDGFPSVWIIIERRAVACRFEEKGQHA